MKKLEVIAKEMLKVERGGGPGRGRRRVLPG
jgi:hypothetical protein